MKACRHCKAEFEPREWQIKTGDYQCGPCRRGHKAAYRAARKAAGNPVVSGRMSLEWHKGYDSTYYSIDENRERRNALMRKYRQAHGTREHYLARSKVRHAIESGKLTRMPCEVCGESKVDGHHDDYSKPLDVRWLCRKHHVEHHAKATGEKA